MSNFAPVLAAERVRTRRTTGARLWIIGLVIAVLQCLGWFTIASSALSDWDQLLGWQTLYATVLCTPIAALVSCLAVRREGAARSGGTPWRRPDAGMTRAARLLVLAGQQLALQVTIVIPMLAFGVLVGIPDAPVGRFAALLGVLWVASLPWVALGLLLAERLGLYATTALAIIWQVAGTLRAEGSTWWLEPWTWGVRPTLPLLHVHANGMGAGPGEAVRDLAILPPVALAAALFGVLAAVVVLAPAPGERRTGGGAGASAQAAAAPTVGGPIVRGRRRTVLAAMRALPLRAATGLSIAAIVSIVATRALWTPAYVHGLVGLVLIPGLACLLACLTAHALAPGLRLALTRVRASTLAASAGSVLVAVLVPVVVGGAALAGRWAGSLLVVGIASGVALLMLDLWLATRFGPGAALGVTLVGVAWSAIFGGSQLAAGPTWILGPWAYAYSATTGDRLLVAAAGSLVVAFPAAYAWTRALRRAAAYA
ncbi:lantibiotic immunity ABC transporter MutE/EpiE family permease subunit [Mariniluteicoccus flavus]